jgi:hypothetical protein
MLHGGYDKVAVQIIVRMDSCNFLVSRNGSPISFTLKADSSKAPYLCSPFPALSSRPLERKRTSKFLEKKGERAGHKSLREEW